jgi:hypothetical protein
LLPHHPEHIDAFVYFITQIKRDVRTIAICKDLIIESPYDYVRGEAWHVIARMMTAEEMVALVQLAIQIARKKTSSFSLKWGACTFLCAAEYRGLGKLSKWLQYQENPILQALLAPILPPDRFRENDVAAQMLKRSAIEPGLLNESVGAREDLARATRP